MKFKSSIVVVSLVVFIGSSWTLETPGARDHLGLAYDQLRNRVVLFGGNDVDASGRYIWNPTTWEWDGQVWQQVDDGVPGAISSMSMVFDGASEHVLVMGGVSPSKGDLDETWLWDGEKWTQHEMTTPGVRLSPAMAFDPLRAEVVLFSGCVGNSYPSDTWTFKNGRWTKAAESGPAGVCRGSMFFDQVRRNIVLFGGALASGGYTNRMWEWDGKSWTEVDQGAVTPSPRANAAMAYDQHRSRGVLYGGMTSDGVSEELWEWNGNGWSEVIHQPTWPGPREVFGITYHSLLKEVLMYGGRSGFAKPQPDFWSWDGERWNRL